MKFKAVYILINVLLFFAFAKQAAAQMCGTAGIDGPANVSAGGSGSAAVNTYFPPLNNVTLNAGSSSIMLDAVPPTDPYGNSFGTIPISIGDLILIIQMQDAVINYNNSNLYGSGSAASGPDGLGGTGYTDLRTTGRFEYVIATSNVPLTGGKLTFRGAGLSGGTKFTYVNQAATTTEGQRTFQIVRVPQFSNLRLTSNISTPPFNGKAGGIIAFDVAGTMNFNGFTVDASARGFRGGYGMVNESNSNTNSLYVTKSNSSQSVGKGEGVAGTPRYMWDGYNEVDNVDEGLPGGSYGRGAPGNAGGGGNDHNSGGGGGGNGGYGGVGGNGWLAKNSAILPSYYPSGGRPGSITYSVSPDPSKIIMGGGGGGGDANNTPETGVNTGVKGGVGGGIVLVNVGRLEGSGVIKANGGDGAPGEQGDAPDGAGGGGAGGTVFVKVSNPQTSTLTIEAKGGRGGNTLNDLNNEHGPGGGGGGGLIFYSNPAPGTVNTDVSAGAAGRAADGAGSSHGAAAGTAGTSVSFVNTSLPDYLQGGGSICYPELKTTITNPNSASPVLSGNVVTYIIKTTNVVSSGNAGGVQIQAKLPSGFIFQTASISYTGSVGGPAAGSATNSGTASEPIFGTFNIPPQGEVVITLKALITCGTPSGTHHASAQAVYLDPTRTITEPYRQITAAANAFPSSNTIYQTGSAGIVPGSNYDGDTASDEDVIISGTECPEVSFEIDSSAVLEASGQASVTVRLSKASSAQVTVPYTLNPAGTAALNTDFSFTSGTSPIVFAPGETVKTIQLGIAVDGIAEPDETVIFDLGTPENAVLGPIPTHTLTIFDPSTTPQVSFEVDNSSIREDGGSIQIKVILSFPITNTINVPFSLTGGTAALTTDFSFVPNGTLQFQSGVKEVYITVNIVDDGLLEPNETVIFTLGNPTGNKVTLGSIIKHTLTIIDDDHPPVAVDDEITITECTTSISGTVAVNDSDPDGDLLSFSLISYDNSKGTLTMSADGSYTFVPNIPFLGPLTVNYRVTDEGGLYDDGILTIKQPNPLLSISLVKQVNVKCFGGNDGSLDIAVTGGVPGSSGYTYQWTGLGSAVFNTEDISGLKAGDYTITATDANGCSISNTYSISEPDKLQIVGTQTDVKCFGGNGGSINLSVTGGTGAYSYSWTGPNGFVSSDEDISSLAYGNYEVTVTDANGCKVYGTYLIEQPSKLQITLDNKTDVNCFGGNDGSINLSVTGGTGAYTYSWIGPNGFVSSDEDISSLAYGNYEVAVTDINGCKVYGTYLIEQPSKLQITLDNKADVNCFGGNDGSINLSVTGGTAPYTYSWIGPNGFVSSNEDISSLAYGNYEVAVTDANGCKVYGTYLIEQPSKLQITLDSKADVNCFGGNDGSINLTVTGGTAPYTYSWIGPNGFVSSNENISSLTYGNYEVTVTDASGCKVYGTYLVEQPSKLQITLDNKTDVNCFGGNDGSINLSVTGGTAPYTYSWTGTGFSSAQEDISSLTAGDYKITVTDANGCTLSQSYTIGQPSKLQITLDNKADVNCFGGNDGSINLTVTGGTAPYTYSWIGPNGFVSSNEDISSLAYGNYEVTVTDANGCKVYGTYLVEQPSKLQITLDNKADVNCFGGNDGSINLSVTGGTAPYTYSWIGPNGFVSSNEDISSLAYGNYEVTVTDANGCTLSQSYTIGQPSKLQITLDNKTDVNCFGGNDGSINLSVTGGTAPYTYSWIGPNGFVSSNEDISSLAYGNYEVAVTDANGCKVYGTYLVEQPSKLQITLDSKADVNCFGGNDGSINLTVTGGTAPYTYSWTGTGFSSAQEDISSLTAGDYKITVTDANGCTLSQSYTIGQPSKLQITLDNKADVNCFGGNDGSINLTVTGGTAPYTYSWTGTGFSSAQEDISSLTAGDYKITVTDANGCTLSQSYTIGQPSKLQITLDNKADVNCFGGNDGSINLTVTGGTAPYTYSWIGPNGFNKTAEDITGLTYGNYEITVTDANGCKVYGTYLIEQPSKLQITLDNKTDVNCFGGNDGSINLSVTGGTAPYTYSWIGPNGFNKTVEDITGLTYGSYEITVTDANGCKVYGTYLIEQPSKLQITLDNKADVNCFGGNDGSINLSVTGGTAPYTYSWIGPNGFVSSNEDISSLAYGNYEVAVTDANGCKVYGTYLIEQPSKLQITLDSKADVNCFGGNDGSINLTVTGGTAPYTYSWIGPNGFVSSNEDISSLAYGNYEVTVTDANGCKVYGTYLIEQPSKLQITLDNKTDVNCFGGNVGSINLTVTGGTAPYTYSWIGPNGFIETAEDITGLTYGNYEITVTDANGCKVYGTYLIEQPSKLQITLDNKADVNCFGGNDGSINLSVTGGTAPYTYSWIGPNGFVSSNEDISSLAYGNYEVAVTDANGCKVYGTYLVEQPSKLQITLDNKADVNCFGGNDGSINLSVTGGTAPYTYSWIGPNGFVSSNEDISSLAYGNYEVTVTDANGCTLSQSYTIGQPSKLQITLDNKTDVNCFGGNDGSINLSVTGGTAPYTYSWIGPNGFVSSNEDISSLAYGNYEVAVTDANGCKVYGTYLVEQPSKLQITLDNKADVNCFGGNDGSINLSVTGGTAPYTYSWTGTGFSSAQEDISSLTAGDYKITVTDANGCTLSQSYTIGQPSKLQITLDNKADVNCFGGNDGSINLSVTGGTAPYTYSWTGTGFSSAQEDISSLTAGDYKITVTDANGCMLSQSYTIGQPSKLQITLDSKADVNCFGGNDGSINLTVTGGTAPYTYSWIGPNGFNKTAEDITGLTYGSYEITVTDANGCKVYGTYLIEQPSKLQITLDNKADVNCFGGNDGSINLSVTGGTAPYTYSWIGPNGFVSSNEDISSLAYGNYEVAVTDANGCKVYGTYLIEQPSKLQITLDSKADVNCFGGNDGSINLTVTGGTAPYTYSWIGPNGFVSSNENISSLTYGNYEVTVTDASGCKVYGTYLVEQPSKLQITLDNKTDVNCFGGNDGSINLSVTGGTAPYTYSWTGTGFSSAQEDISSLTAGDYKITVTDANGCTLSQSYTIGQPSKLQITLDNKADVNCFGGNDGSINLTVTGGTAPYTYSWIGPNGFVSSNEDISSLAYGNYEVTVTDANGCKVYGTYLIEQPSKLQITLDNKTDVNCFGGNVGSINLTVTGGTAPYTYSWIGPNGFIETAEDITGLTYGNYEITVTDANGCKVYGTYLIEQPSKLQITLDNKADVNCFGGNDGSINLSVTGGTAPYTYSWIGPNGFVSSNEDISSLAYGNYEVAVTDANGCKVYGTYLVEQPSKLQITLDNKADVNCFGGNDGSINLSVTGGTAPYTYSWTGTGFSSAQEDISSLTAGDYKITVTDANGCMLSQSYTIGQPSKLQITLDNKADVNCFGGNDGSINLTVTGGTVPYTYSWIGPNGFVSSNEDISSLAYGNYEVAVTDANGCKVYGTYLIEQPSKLQITLDNKADVNCFGGNDGSINLSVTGGTAPYTYSWIGPNGFVSSNEDISSLAYGNYEVAVTDANGCKVYGTYLVEQPSKLQITLDNKADVNCFGGNDGSINLSVTGGTAPYTYSWIGPNGFVSSNEDISSLAYGNYEVTVTDANGCKVYGTYLVEQPSKLQITLDNKADVNCFGGNDGSINLSVTGGTAPYTYSWIGPNGFVSSNEDISSLAYGNYEVTVTDANGCTLSQSYTIGQPSKLQITLDNKTDVNCFGGNDGSINLSVTGGTAPYTYSWIGPNGFVSSNEDISSLAYGNYEVAVTDANGCKVYGTYLVEQPSKLQITLDSKADVNCFGGNDGSINLTVTGGTAPYTYSWTGTGFSSAQEDISSLTAGDYKITVTDANGCTLSQSYTIGQPSKLQITLDNKTDVKCFGANTGAININVTGGKTPYIYRWTGPNGFVSGQQNLSNLTAGTYKLSVTDVNGCAVQSEEWTITQPAQLKASFTVQKPLCKNSNEGRIVLSVSGGLAPYTFNWQGMPDIHASEASGLTAGTYSVIITDANNCAFSLENIIVEPGNCPPAAANDQAATNQDTAVEISVLENDADPDGVLNTLSLTIVNPPQHGTVQLHADGRVTYTPNPGYRGSDSFTYTVKDDGGMVSNPAVVNLTVIAVNAPPRANDDSFETEQNVLLHGCVCPNDSDPDGDKLAFSVVQQPAHGTLSFASKNGDFSYAPNENFTGTDTFMYKICDPYGACDEAVVTINVFPTTIVRLTPAAVRIKEGGKRVITATLERPFSEDVVIYLSYTGTAAKERDYFLFDQYQEIRIPAGQVSTKDKITIHALTDHLEEGDETIEIKIVSVSSPRVKIGNNTLVTIEDVYPAVPEVDPPVQSDPENKDIKPNPLVSPNGDGQNDYFKIDNIAAYPDNEVVVFNRWGNEVFRIKGYDDSDKTFKGVANTGLLISSSQPLPDGVYYYLIYTKQTINGEDVMNLNKGYLILKRE